MRLMEGRGSWTMRLVEELQSYMHVVKCILSGCILLEVQVWLHNLSKSSYFPFSRMVRCHAESVGGALVVSF